MADKPGSFCLAQHKDCHDLHKQMPNQRTVASFRGNMVGSTLFGQTGVQGHDRHRRLLPACKKGNELIASALKDRRILVVEDEFFIAMDMTNTLQSAEAIVLGPAGRVGASLELVEREPEICAAVLDVNIGGETVYPVADALLERSVPFIFATGERPDTIPQRFADVPVCQKPVDPADLVQRLTDVLLRGREAPSA